MRNKLFIVLLLLFGAVIWGYMPAYAQASECEQLVRELPFDDEEYGIELGENFVANQAILFGLTMDVDQVLANISPDLLVQPLRAISGGEFLCDQKLVLVRSGSEDAYALVEEIYATIARLDEQNALKDVVYVDFNYLVNSGQPIIGPHSVGAHPFGSITSPGLSTRFEGQWAFTTQYGIDLLTGTPLARTVSSEGQPTTHVAIFDTSPYQRPGLRTIAIGVPGVAASRVMLLDVIHYALPSLRLEHGHEELIDVGSHGLFVAGLVHAVAPGVSIELVKMMNEQGRGHEFWVLEALTLYLDNALNNRRTLKGTVVNLSLGVHPPPMSTLPVTLTAQIDGFLSRTGYPALPTGAPPVFALRRLLSAAYDSGAAIVASAGNDSNGVTLRLMQEPAIYPFVIGAVGSNRDGFRSCFSNPGYDRGDVAVPGGDGESSSCNPLVIRDPAKCSASNCPYALISVILTNTTPGSEQYEFAFWLGTSFAAPLVSGIAALTHERLAPMWAGLPNSAYSALLVSEIPYWSCRPPPPPGSRPHGLRAGLLNMKVLLNVPSPNRSLCP
jgi:hypothetical protein